MMDEAATSFVAGIPKRFIPHISSFILFLSFSRNFSKITTMNPLAAYRSTLPSGTGLPTTAKNSVLGMVIMRINHEVLPTQESARSPIAFSSDIVSEGTWNIAMNSNVVHPELLRTLAQPNSAVQVMELWNEQIPSADKPVFLQELGIALQQNIMQANSSVLTHNFCILGTKNGYHSFQWICSILPDRFGNVSRITASLRVLSPQVRPIH
jgi:hypothetical protein